MVLYYTPRGAETTGHVVYVGADKHENEHLIQWGLPHDVWFHVDKLSSAHVYLRMSPGQTMDDITPEELEDCAQLVKANSIAGNKQNDLYVVYTPWENLRKGGDMDVGQVAFKNEKAEAVRRTKVKTRINDIVNRLNKTKVERFPDLQAEREAYDEGVRRAKKEAYRVAERERLEEERAREADREARDYKHMVVEYSMKSNKEMAKKFASVEEARMAEDYGRINLHQAIRVRVGGELIVTTAGRVIFNANVPENIPFVNEVVDKGAIERVTSDVHRAYGNCVTADFLDGLKALGYDYATTSGLTISMDDVVVPPQKDELIDRAKDEVGKIVAV